MPSLYNLLVAVILGLVEGATEFIPVSSTGHLIIVGNLLNFTGPVASIFEIFIQLGAILAVVVLYFQRFLDLLKLNKTEGFNGLRGIGLLIIGVLPAAIVGYLAHDLIKGPLFQPITVAVALFVGGIAILLVERFHPEPKVFNLDELTWKHALLIGLFQVLSVWPGVSRAAATILGGMILGLKRETAAEFSFLLAVPTIIGAAGLDLVKNLDILQPSDGLLFAVGFIVAFVAAILAIRGFVRYVSNRSLVPFGWYRMVIAVLVFLVMR
jgi:undecaprenyl-diphosphatase